MQSRSMWISYTLRFPPWLKNVIWKQTGQSPSLPLYEIPRLASHHSPLSPESPQSTFTWVLCPPLHHSPHSPFTSESLAPLDIRALSPSSYQAMFTPALSLDHVAVLFALEILPWCPIEIRLKLCNKKLKTAMCGFSSHKHIHCTNSILGTTNLGAIKNEWHLKRSLFTLVQSVIAWTAVQTVDHLSVNKTLVSLVPLHIRVLNLPSHPQS